MSTAPLVTAEDFAFAADVAREAGRLVLRHRHDGVEARQKSGATDDLVTLADREASELIVSRVRAFAPSDGVLSEEMTDNRARLGRRRVWVIDPIDGTKEFASASPDFAVSVGLVVDGAPMLGAVCAPATNELFVGGLGAVTRNGEAAGLSRRPLGAAIVAVSATEYERELIGTPLRGMKPSGSIALKLARIAAGEADATFTINPRSEWDVCAGHALVRAAGGDLTFRDGAPIRYNAGDPTLRRGLIGGRADVTAWLTSELDRLDVPQQHLFVRDGEPAFDLLPPEWRGHDNVHVRTAGGALESIVVLERAGRAFKVVHQGGAARGVAFIVRNLRRALNVLDEAEVTAPTTSDASG